MKGLVWKELITVYQRQNKISLLLTELMMLFLLLKFDSPYIFFTVMLGHSVSCAGFSANLFEMDGKSNFDRFAISLPLKKNDIVTSRYLANLFLVAIITIIMLLFALLSFTLQAYFTFDVYVKIVLISSLVSVLFTYLNLAGFYVLGINGGSIVMLILIGIAVLGFLFVSLTNLNLDFLLTMSPTMLTISFLMSILILCYGCYLTSCYFYRRGHS